MENIEDIQMFVVNMTSISVSDLKTFYYSYIEFLRGRDAKFYFLSGKVQSTILPTGNEISKLHSS